MDFERCIVRYMENVALGEVQVVISHDVNVPDTHPDIGRLLATRGNAIPVEVHTSGDRMNVRGVLEYGCMYHGDLPAGLSGSIEFGETVNLHFPHGVEASCHCDAVIDNLAITVVHPRKINIRAVVVLKAFSEFAAEAALPVKVSSQELLLRHKEIETFDLKANISEVRRIRKIFDLPSDRPNIGEVVYTDASAFVKSLRPATDGFHVDFGIVLSAVYKTAGGDDYVWFRMTDSLQQVLEVSGISDDMVCHAMLKQMDCRVLMREDYDGEERCLEVDLGVRIDAVAFGASAQNVITDCCQPGKSVSVDYSKQAVCGRAFRNNMRCAVNAMLDNNASNNIKIFTYSAVPSGVSGVLTDGKLELSGLLEVCVVGEAVDGASTRPVDAGAGRLVSIHRMVPFSQTMDLKSCVDLEAVDDVKWRFYPALEQMSLNITTQGLELKAFVNLDVLVLGMFDISVVGNVLVEELDREEYMALAQVVGYIVGDDEDIWDIASKNHTTVEDIIECNRLPDDRVKPGDRLVVMRRALSQEDVCPS